MPLRTLFRGTQTCSSIRSGKACSFMRYHSLLDHVQQLEKLGVVAIRLPRQKQLWVLPLLRVLRDDFLGVVHSPSQRAVLDQHELNASLSSQVNYFCPAPQRWTTFDTFDIHSSWKRCEDLVQKHISLRTWYKHIHFLLAFSYNKRQPLS